MVRFLGLHSDSDRLYDALETSNLDLDSPAPRIRDLNEKRDLVQRARTEVEETLVEGRIELVSREVVLEYLLDFREALEYSSVVERRAFSCGRSFGHWIWRTLRCLWSPPCRYLLRSSRSPRPEFLILSCLVELGGLEPPTPSLQGRCSPN